MMDRKGFTLIELLVTISIIGIISVIGIVSYGKVQEFARDTKKKADIDAIAKVMEQKYNFLTQKYQGYQDSDFSGGKHPQQDPTTNTNYALVYGTDNKNFQVCADLSGGVPPYCRSSTRGGKAPDVPATKPCVGNKIADQPFSDNMAGCDGSKDFSHAQELCGTGWKVCHVSDFIANGGDATHSNPTRWLADTSNSTGNACSTNVCQGGICEYHPTFTGNYAMVAPHNGGTAAYTDFCPNSDDKFGYIGTANMTGTTVYSLSGDTVGGTMCCK